MKEGNTKSRNQGIRNGKTIEKINKIKIWFMEMIVDNLQQDRGGEKREKTNYHFRNETEVITTDLADIKSTIKEYYKQLYKHKFDNLEEIY